MVSPPTDPQPLPPDTGFLYVDQNADRYPTSPISPLFAAVRRVQPTYPFAPVDVISDRSPLRKLYGFAAGDPNLKNFRFGVRAFGEGVKGEEKQGEEKQGEEKQREEKQGEEKKNTVVFHCMEKMTREEYKAGHSMDIGRALKPIFTSRSDGQGKVVALPHLGV